jgi:hypothetical protein
VSGRTFASKWRMFASVTATLSFSPETHNAIRTSWIATQYSATTLQRAVDGFQQTEMLRHRVLRLHIHVPHCCL